MIACHALASHKKSFKNNPLQIFNHANPFRSSQRSITGNRPFWKISRGIFHLTLSKNCHSRLLSANRPEHESSTGLIVAQPLYKVNATDRKQQPESAVQSV
jgi:hypothetical protein